MAQSARASQLRPVPVAGAKPPKHLSKDAATWWHSVVGEFDLSATDLLVLARACEALDRAAEARETLKREGLTYRDRYDNPRKHPAAAIELESRAAFAKLVRQLDLEGAPDPMYRR